MRPPRALWRNCLFSIGVLVGSAVIGAGCDDDRSVRTYQTAKDTSPPASPFGAGPAAASPADQPGPASSPTEVGWVLPIGWKMLPPPTDPQARAMEVARIGVDEADPKAMLTIVPLSGEGGDLLPNVARWQGQLKLPVATNDADVQKVVAPMDTPLGNVPVVDLASPAGSEKPQRIVAAAVPLQGFTVFITLRGPEETITRQRSHFDQFVRSLRFTAANSDTSADNGAQPPPNQPTPPMAPPSPPSPGPAAAARLSYTAPHDWKPSAAQNDMRVLGFSAGPDLITVDRLPAGGMDNLIPLINMWRSQVDLGPLPDDAPIKPDAAQMIDGHLSNVFDIAGAASTTSKRVIVAMVAVGDEDWFIKLIGPTDAVARQRPAFMAFMRSIHFASGASAAGGG